MRARARERERERAREREREREREKDRQRERERERESSHLLLRLRGLQLVEPLGLRIVLSLVQWWFITRGARLRSPPPPARGPPAPLAVQGHASGNKAHRLVYHSTLGLRLIKKKKNNNKVARKCGA